MAGFGDDTGADVTDPNPSDADLTQIGFDPNTIVSPADRAAAVKAYNDARTAMAKAQQGKTLDAVSQGVGVAVVALTFSFPPAAALLSAFWAGSLAAWKGLQAVFGTAHGGPGQWTDWCGNTPPIDPNDPNWWHADTGYADALAKHGRGADTPWTRNLLGQGWPREPEMHGFGDVNARIARVDPKAQDFARFAMPLVYQAYELTMNCRNWSKIGSEKYANLPSDLGKTESGTKIPNPFDAILGMWNSQHAGPSVDIPNGGVFPLAPDHFSLNTGALISKKITGNIHASGGAPPPMSTGAKVAIAGAGVAAVAVVSSAVYGVATHTPFAEVWKHLFSVAKHALTSTRDRD